MFKAFKLIVFYSEILPKKYQAEFLTDVQQAVDRAPKTARFGRKLTDKEMYLENRLSPEFSPV